MGKPCMEENRRNRSVVMLWHMHLRLGTFPIFPRMKRGNGLIILDSIWRRAKETPVYVMSLIVHVYLKRMPSSLSVLKALSMQHQKIFASIVFLVIESVYVYKSTTFTEYSTIIIIIIFLFEAESERGSRDRLSSILLLFTTSWPVLWKQSSLKKINVIFWK